MRFLLFSLAALVTAAPTSNHVLHERRSESSSWVKLDRLHEEAKLPVRIGLTQQNLDRIDELLLDVSHPDSPQYGKHYTPEEIIDVFAPHENTVDIVREWLHSAGLDPETISQSVNKQWMQFDASVAELENLLRTKYHTYRHQASGKETMGCDMYYVPEHVREHVDYITPGIKLLTTDTKKKSDGTLTKRQTVPLPSGIPSLPPITAPLPLPLDVLLALPLVQLCDVAITPECIMTMYNITAAKSAVAGNELGIFEDLGDHYSQQDLTLFFETLAENIPSDTHPKLEGIDGATGPTSVTSAGAESDLDFQISYPLIYPQNSILFQTDDDYTETHYKYEGFLNNFLDGIDGSYCTFKAFGEKGNSPLDPPYPDPHKGGYKGNLQCGVYKPTNVISISYGGQEADLPPSYQKRQCLEFAKLGMQGVSVLLASGDSGVAGPAGDDSKNGCLMGGKVFSPDFPASCPHLTSVGATFLPPGGDVNSDQETAVTRFASGGGFSNIYPIPSYQSKAVATYFATSDPKYPYYKTTNAKNIGAGGGIYNRIGRGYPDVSAVGDNIIIFNMGAPTLIGGTSASSPTFASILTRINNERLAAGKSTIGFVNPVLYKHPQVLHDITTGDNPGCGTNGFNASKGWDPVTGLGTPNYPAMLKLFMGL